MYYREHFSSVELFFGALDPTEAQSILSAQEILSLPAIKLQLSAIAANYSPILKAITRLETSGMSLTQSIRIVSDLETSLRSNDGLITGKRLRIELLKLKSAMYLHSFGAIEIANFIAISHS